VAVTAALPRDHVREEVGHSHWVFVMPKMLRLYFLHHRQRLHTAVGGTSPVEAEDKFARKAVA
jgi:hypothetical protein